MDRKHPDQTDFNRFRQAKNSCENKIRSKAERGRSDRTDLLQ